MIPNIEDMPERIKNSLDNYVKYGHCGGCIQAIMSNNLVQAFSRADDDYATNMHAIVMYMYNRMPGDCWGSPEAVKNWRGTERSA